MWRVWTWNDTKKRRGNDYFMRTLGINFLFSRNANYFSVKILSMKSGRVGKDWGEGGCYEMRLDVGKCISAGLRQRATGQKLVAITQRNELYGIIVTGQVSSFPDQKRTGAGGQRRQSGLWVPGWGRNAKEFESASFLCPKVIVRSWHCVCMKTLATISIPLHRSAFSWAYCCTLPPFFN